MILVRQIASFRSGIMNAVGHLSNAIFLAKAVEQQKLATVTGAANRIIQSIIMLDSTGTSSPNAAMKSSTSRDRFNIHLAMR
jgi:hypothetical protein